METCQAHSTISKYSCLQALVVWQDSFATCPACQMQARIEELEERMTWKEYPETKPKKPGEYGIFWEGYRYIDYFDGQTFDKFENNLITHWLDIPPLPERN